MGRKEITETQDNSDAGEVIRLSGFDVVETNRPDEYALRAGNGLKKDEEMLVDVNSDRMIKHAMFTTPRKSSRISISGVNHRRTSTRNNIHMDIVLEPPMPTEAALEMACKMASLTLRAERD